MTLLPRVNSSSGIDNEVVSAAEAAEACCLLLLLLLQLQPLCKRKVGRVQHTPTSNKPVVERCTVQP